MTPDVLALHGTDPDALGPYHLLGRLGEGGMGVVYLAKDASGQQVAVKAIHRLFASDPEFHKRFRREVESARRVPRFCTAAVLDASLDAETPYLVTEYVDGPSLHDAVTGSGLPLSGEALSALAVGIAAALTAIHEVGVVHRDLKPSNVLLSCAGPRVIDFGIASAADATSHTLTGQMMGTPAYMAPEQISRDRASPAADVFAWGGVVAFAANADGPFGQANSLPALMHRVLHEPPRLDALEPGLRQIVARAMEKDPERRPTSPQLLEQVTAYAERAERGLAAEILDHATVVPRPEELDRHPPTVPPPSQPTAGPGSQPPRPLGPRPMGPPTSAPYADLPTTAPGSNPPVPLPAYGAAATELPSRPDEDPTRLPASNQAPTAFPANGGYAAPTEMSQVMSPPWHGPPPAAARRRGSRSAVLITVAALTAVILLGAGVLVDPFGWRDAGADQQASDSPSDEQTDSGGKKSDAPPSDPITLTDYRGKDADTVVRELENAGVQVETEFKESTQAESGTVVSSDPAPGTEVSGNDVVTLFVGDGTKVEQTWKIFKRYVPSTPINESPVVTVAPDGTQHEIGEGDSPAISDDGKRIAFVKLDKGFAGQAWVADPTGKNQRKITDVTIGSVQEITFSPDGRQIAYGNNTGGIYVVNVDGSGRRTISDGDAFEMDWSPDGKSIIYRTDNNLALNVVSVADGSTRELKIKLPKVGDITPGPAFATYSPDGTQIAFTDFQGSVYTSRANGGGLKRVTDGGYPTWTSTGDLVIVRGDGAFVRNPSSGAEQPLSGIVTVSQVHYAAR